MDDQQHRRRRQRMDPDSSPSSASFNAPNASISEESAAPQAQPAHRRRRAADSAPADSSPEEVFWHPQSETPDDSAAPETEKKGLLRWFSAVDALVCRIGDSLLSALKWLLIGLMFLLNALLVGLRKAGAFLLHLRSAKPSRPARSAVHTGKRLHRRPAQEREDVTLEPTRPEDYRGLGEQRSAHGKKRVVRAPGTRPSLAYSAAMAALLCVAAVSVFMIGSILLRTIRTNMLSSSLSERYTQLSERATEESSPSVPQETAAFAPETPSPMPTSAPTDSAAPQETDGEPQITPVPQPDAVKSTKFHQVGGDALPEMEAFYLENRDLVGWLRMEGILDLPVVYRDNDYYLKRDFYKNKSAAGTLFLDENHPFRENAQNLLLHGHNMKDGTMFGRLVQYETNLQFLKNNPFIQYSTLWKKEQYVIFAVLHVSLDVHDASFFNYFSHHTFSSDAQFENYVRSLQNRSLFSIPIDVGPSDALLTLSTCLDDDRLVIVARRVREGESKSELRHLVQLAAKQ